MKKKHLFSFLSAIMLVFFLAACQSVDNKVEGNKNAEPIEKSESYTVTDDRDKEVPLEKVPETVISLIPSNTEILYALEVGDKVIGVTDYDNFPEEVSDVERVSDTVKFDAERIIELKPDVVFAYTIGDEEGLKVLEDANIPVFVIESAASFEDVYGDIIQISEVMNVKEKGEELVADIQSKIKEVKDKVVTVDEKQKLYFEISPAPDLYTTGKNTFQQEIMNHANVENIFEDLEGWPAISEEEVILRNPPLIVTTVSYLDNAVEEIKARTSWENIEAIKNDNVHFLDSDITSRPGPRIAEAVELAAKTAYPDLFK